MIQKNNLYEYLKHIKKFNNREIINFISGEKSYDPKFWERFKSDIEKNENVEEELKQVLLYSDDRKLNGEFIDILVSFARGAE